ncbi:uncharacterized protein J4E79_011280 [Alternaria viburni]|uniref:uncharacterized protein n=1 Tax=Alternaria viburni TaxID=566460 RepID=UPI0020C3063E|nr:uncharacterized protein J4E79_011280 [Alternaria viburni]KAI4643339.1 hypothetical protein J4E79_011280 [Alternaria viburni]
MNVERCISLHNEIVRHGWVGSGRSPDTLASHSKSWFEVFGDEAEVERSALSPDLVQFLEHRKKEGDIEKSGLSIRRHNLDVLEKLVDAIESRMPTASRSQATDSPAYGLLDDNIRDTIDLPQRFAFNFLFRARRPRFKMIAPGLRIIPSADFPDQPFRSYMSKDKEEVPPVLLFQSDLNFFEDPTWTPQSPDDAMVPNFFDYRDIKTYPSGLYLLPTNHRSLEDGISCVLPYAIGGKGFARRGDGTDFAGGEEWRGRDSFTELYQPGRRALEEFQAQSLAGVLESWLGMVERGDWEVDENGVVGHMETWREADTEEGWRKYVISSEEPSNSDWGWYT